MRELSILAGMPDAGMNFSEEEIESYTKLKGDPELISATANTMVSSIDWAGSEFFSCGISIYRVCRPTYVCTTPTLALKAADHRNLRASQIGLMPFSYLMPLTPNAYVDIALGDFDGAFTNQQVDEAVENGLKRHVVAQFSYWPHVKHMICSADGLIDHLKWAGYNCVHDTANKKTFIRDSSFRKHQEVS